jgi:hypothetical protein
VVDMYRIDDSFVRVVKGSRLSRLKQVSSDDFATSDDLSWLHHLDGIAL